MGIESYQKGKKGEEIAKIYLEHKGSRVLEQNFHSQQGEIDLIVQDKNLLVFVEVKNYSYRSYGSPFGAVTKSKRNSIIHAARTYLYRNRIKNVNCRFDVISIYHKKDGTNIIDHLEDAFYAG